MGVELVVKGSLVEYDSKRLIPVSLVAKGKERVTLYLVSSGLLPLQLLSLLHKAIYNRKVDFRDQCWAEDSDDHLVVI